MSEVMNGEEVEEINTFEEISREWQEIVDNPDLLTDLSEQKVIFAAGGGLVSRFGVEDSGIWQGLVEVAEQGEVEVAGIEFSICSLRQMGDYYRFMKEKGFNFHCIDERLEGDKEHLEDEVHVGCGACAAVGQATGLDNIEDRLLDETGQKTKQEIYKDMPNHESMVILVDLKGADVVLGGKRDELKSKKALPFNVSIPLEYVAEWAGDEEGKARSLINTLVKWNVQIARNIIGSHNNLSNLAEKTIIVVDERDLVEGDLGTSTQEAIGKVDHGEIKEII